MVGFVSPFSSAFTLTSYTSTSTSTLSMRLTSALFFSLFAIVSALSSHQQLSNLAATSNGVITLDADSFDLITAPNRNWSAAIQLTALDPKRRCAPCKSVHVAFPSCSRHSSTLHTENLIRLGRRLRLHGIACPRNIATPTSSPLSTLTMVVILSFKR